MKDVKTLIDGLFNKNSNLAYECLKKLLLESEGSAQVYAYFDTFADMLDSDNSYIRVRGFLLIAYNARWDTDFKIDEIIDGYLKHITDYKPIAARQCIKALPLLAKHKPELRQDIINALHKADLDKYKQSMKPLLISDINDALKQINQL